MIAGTHIAFASALYLGGAALFEYEPTLIGWALASAASLGPDIDLPTSKAGRVFFWLSTRLERDFGHRTITHSLIALAVVTMLAGALYPIEPAWFWAIVGGYWSHIWIDMVNLRGADLLWPSPVRFVFPGNRNYRMETGSKAEMVLMTAMLAACLLLYPVSGLGFRVGLQQLLGNFDMAHDAFLKNAGSYWYTLKLEAVDNLTLEKIHCDCPVVGAWKEGLIVIHDGRARAVGKSQLNHNLFPIHAELIRGEPLRVVSQRVNLRGRSLRWLTDSLDQAHTYYINGQVVVGRRTEPIEDLDLYRPATLTGKVLRLHYAKAEELAPHLDLVAAEGEVYVQYWLRPEDEAVEMTVSEEGEREVVPEALAGYL
ncbi:MAG: metal-dependent hydrolase [Caldilineaceae bacterium]|nr:metal-dependent hydrolase [Caldilineaceae bacterium]